MAEIKFSPEVLSDLKHIKSYIAEELLNEQAADNTVADIIKRIRTLSDLPQSGAPLSSVISIETNYRFIVCNNYTAFYRYENGSVYIARVLYGRRDFMRILFEEK